MAVVTSATTPPWATGWRLSARRAVEGQRVTGAAESASGSVRVGLIDVAGLDQAQNFPDFGAVGLPVVRCAEFGEGRRRAKLDEGGVQGRGATESCGRPE